MDKIHTSDVRFGTTFLDVDYKDKSVKGEILSDKMDGELYIRRPIDGKIVSFSQKASNPYEMMKDFNIQFLTANGFNYPTRNSYFAGVKFNINELSELDANKLRADILTENSILPGRSSIDDEFTFTVSDVTNGFFFKPILRYGDRNVVGFLSGEFRNQEDYGALDDSFRAWLDNSELYGASAIYDVWKNTNDWDISNAVMMYTIKITGTNTAGKTMEKSIPDISMIRLNEHTFIKFPVSYRLNMVTIDKITVTINKLMYPKLQYSAQRYRTANNGYMPYMKKLMEPDYQVNLKEAEVFYFVDRVDQLPNEIHATIHHFVDYAFMLEAIQKINVNRTRAFISQPQEVVDGEWEIDSVWNEELRRVNGLNKVYILPDSGTTIQDIEKSIYYTCSIEIEFTTMKTTKNGIYVETLKRVI